MGTNDSLHVFGLQHELDMVLRPSGVLDLATYSHMRDAMLKAAYELPRSVIVNVADLTEVTPSCWAVFPTVRWQVNIWPDVPIAVVCADRSRFTEIRRSGITRYVPVFLTEDEASSAIAAGEGIIRRRGQLQLPGDDDGTAVGRFVGETLHAWGLDERTDSVTRVAETLLATADTALQGHGGALRIESAGHIVVAVTRHRDSAPGTTSAEPSWAGLNELGHRWGRASTADRATLWVVVDH